MVNKNGMVVTYEDDDDAWREALLFSWPIR